MPIASWLMTLIGPLALRVLAVLGIGTVTFTGVTASLQGLIDLAMSNWSGLSADILGLSAIAGIPQAIGIICGAMTAKVGLWAAVSATRWVVGGA